MLLPQGSQSFKQSFLRKKQKSPLYSLNCQIPQKLFPMVEDFSLPTANNLSERGLRGVKSHMKLSGQFESEIAADNHALNRTYIETCCRNGINEIDTLQLRSICHASKSTVNSNNSGNKIWPL